MRTDETLPLSRRMHAATQDGLVRSAATPARRGEVSVLILTDEESIDGLVVMVLNRDDVELVFTNIAGVIDLNALGPRRWSPRSIRG